MRLSKSLGFRDWKPSHDYERVEGGIQQEKGCCPTCGTRAQAASIFSTRWVMAMMAVSSAFIFSVGIALITASNHGRVTSTSSEEPKTLWSELILDKRPFAQIEWMKNDVFVDKDPYEGKWDTKSKTAHSEWDDIYRGKEDIHF